MEARERQAEQPRQRGFWKKHRAIAQILVPEESKKDREDGAADDNEDIWRWFDPPEP